MMKCSLYENKFTQEYFSISLKRMINLIQNKVEEFYEFHENLETSTSDLHYVIAIDLQTWYNNNEFVKNMITEDKLFDIMETHLGIIEYE